MHRRFLSHLVYECACSGLIVNINEIKLRHGLKMIYIALLRDTFLRRELFDWRLYTSPLQAGRGSTGAPVRVP